ncbi:MAG: VTT domain-containing protein [bacterium]|nr:VTT domain-containing protein [bacterium]
MTKKNIVAMIALAVLAVGFWSFQSLQTAFGQAVSIVENYILDHQILGIAAFIGFGAIAIIITPFSSIPLVPFVVPIWGKWLTLLFVVAGWMLGSIVTYAIGRYALRGLLARFVAFEKIEKYQKDLPDKQEFLIVLLFRIISSPTDLAGYILGSIRYHFGKYLLITLIAETLLAFVTVFASQSFIDRRPVHVILWIAISALVVAVMVYIFRKKTKR